MKEENNDKSIKELDKEQREVKTLGEAMKNLSEVASLYLENEINKKALKIGRKVLDEIYLHGEDKVEVSIRKSSIFYWSVVDVGVHSVTGLSSNEIKFIKEEGLTEMSYKDFEIKNVSGEK